MLKKVISKADERIFHGFFKKIYKKILMRRNNFFHGKRSVILREPVSDMILMQTDRHENQFCQYMVYDYAVRYLAIENYYGKNQIGFKLYRKMHMRAGNYGDVNQRNEYLEKKRKKNKKIFMRFAGIEQHSEEQFKKLIQSIEKRGFDSKSVVMADRNLLSTDGAHRNTLAVYFGEDYLNVEIKKKLGQRRYSLDWFWKNGFEREEIQLIEQKMKDIIQKCHEKTGYFYCILYPPAETYFDDITEDLSCVSPENISVIEYHDYEWQVEEFKGFMKGIYYFDSIIPENFERKMYYILRSSEIRGNKVKFRIVTIDIKDPMYRLKSINGMPESVATVRMKDMIRNRYKVKEKKFTEHYVGDYAHDVIIHSSDNYISNQAFRVLLKINRDLSKVIHAIDTYEYFIDENSNDKPSRNFPESFYLGDSFNIVVVEKDLNDIVEAVYQACCDTFKNSPVNIEIRNLQIGKRIYVTYNNFIITMMDFTTTLHRLGEPT